jgi:hypothetical protein
MLTVAAIEASSRPALAYRCVTRIFRAEQELAE